jgi:hypothetical protein
MSKTKYVCPVCKGELTPTSDILHHTYFTCENCREIYAVKGQDHWFHVDEIDLETGEIYPYEPVSVVDEPKKEPSQ